MAKISPLHCYETMVPESDNTILIELSKVTAIWRVDPDNPANSTLTHILYDDGTLLTRRLSEESFVRFSKSVQKNSILDGAGI